MGKEKISFYNKTGINLLPFFKNTKKLAAMILKNFNAQVNFIFVNQNEIKKLNMIYFKKKQPTDVISFNLRTHAGEIGEAYICVDQAQYQARLYGHSLYCELTVLLVHSCLHLLGREDKTPALRKAMNEETLQWLKKDF